MFYLQGIVTFELLAYTIFLLSLEIVQHCIVILIIIHYI